MTPEIPSDVCVHVEKKEAGMMDPGQDQLQSSSAGTGLETLGQQCPPNGETWETGRTIADGYLLVDMGLNQEGDISPPMERVGTRAGTATVPVSSSNNIFLHYSRAEKPKTRHAAKRTSNMTPHCGGDVDNHFSLCFMRALEI